MAAGKPVYGDKMVTPIGRMVWVYVFERPKPKKDGSESPYETSILIPKAQDISALKAALERVGKEAFGKRFVSLEKLKTSPIRDGDDFRDKNGDLIPHYAGHWKLKATTKNVVPVVNAQRVPITKQENSAQGIYSGCWARLHVTAASFETDENWGVKFFMNAIQKVRDDQPLGGGAVNPDEVFEAFAIDDPQSVDENF